MLNSTAFHPPYPPRVRYPVPAHLGRRRLLLAEDDDELRAVLARALRGDGHEVIEVIDGGRFIVQVAAAYEHPKSRAAFDLVLSDVRLPVATGISIVETLRRAHWVTPVILMSAYGDDELRMRADKARAVLFDKPFELDDMRTVVLNLLLHGAPPPAPPASS